MEELRSKANEFLLTEDWLQAIKTYTQLISFYQQQKTPKPDPKHKKSLCLALCNRAEARSKLRDFELALKDCEQSLEIDKTHFKTHVCKGKILLNLDRYSLALHCFEQALLLDPNGKMDILNGFIEKCKKLESLSRNGNFDVSSWVLNGFCGKCPELSEFVGFVEVKKSEISGRGLFCTKNIDVGGLVLVTKAIAIERCILPKSSSENSQLVMWKKLIDKVSESCLKCSRMRGLVGMLSSGENEDDLDVFDVSHFKNGGQLDGDGDIDQDAILSILDVNSMVEEGVSSRVLGPESEYYGVGLWLLPSLINHSCSPNVRRVHVGDYMVVIASRDIKVGEEMCFAYYDVLSPLSKRIEMGKTWGFQCGCKRCKYELEMESKLEMEEIIEGGLDVGCVVFRLEEYMRRGIVRGKGKGYLRASFWKAFSEVYQCEKTMRRWGRKIPSLEPIVESLVEAVGSDERVVKVLIRKLKKCGGGFGEMERAIKLGRGVYGKIVKKQALRILLEFGVNE